MSSSGLGGEDQRDSFVCCKHWTLYLSSTTGYLVTREAIEFSRSWEGLARPSKGSRQGHWARLGMGALSTSAPAVPLLAPVCSLHPNPLPSPGVGPIPCSAVGLRRLGTGGSDAGLPGCPPDYGAGFFGGREDGLARRREGRYEEDVSRTKEKSQDRAEGMGNFFLDGKKIFCCWETEAE